MRLTLVTLPLLCMLCLTSFALAATLPCSNPTPATQAQVDASGGAIQLGTPTCPIDQQLGISNDAGAAKAYLLSIAKDLRGSQAPPDKAHIDPLNNSFAICAANFLKAYIQAYGPVNVVSAFRCGPNSPATIQCNRSENANAGGATNSNHQLGVAMDINPAGGNSSYETLRSFAQANPGYGVTFPWPFYNGSIDKNHMQATNPSNPSCSGVTGTPVTPNTSNNTPLDNILRSVLGGNQNQLNTTTCFTSLNPPLIAQPGTVQQSQCLSSGTTAQPQLPAQPAASAQPAAPAQPAASTQPTLPAQPIVSPETQTPVSDLLDLNTTAASGTVDIASSTSDVATTSAIDQINEIANPVSDAIDIGSAVPIDLNASTTQDVSGLQGSLDQGDDTSNTSGAVASYTPPQTFTSQDLVNSPAPYAQQSGFLTGLLSTLRQIVSYASGYLTPFGSVTLTQQSYE